MFPRHIQSMRRAFSRLALLALISCLLLCSSFASASATLFLEEPYGGLGFFTATGHAAVYLSGVCADTPLHLRPCAREETGVVLSRYDGVGGYDWIAIPLIPYLYAVDRAEDVPLFADAKMVFFLRDQYRRKNLESVAPDLKDGGPPGGNWYELVGSSYDRTIYGFEIATTPEQDAALIRRLNSSPNVSHFRTVSENCADFAKDIINFYYPKALHRSVFADIGITTPKQMAKMLVKYNQRHPEIPYSRMEIAQVPGSMPRSFAVHGVVETLLKSKKYFVPTLVGCPICAGSVVAVYVGTGAGRFKPPQNAEILNPGGHLERPLDAEDFRAYQHQLKNLLAETYPVTSGENVGKAWSRLQAKARKDFDDEGRPVLQVQFDGHMVRVGASADNVLDSSAPPLFVRELLEARLQSELRAKSPHGVTESEVARDWKLLQQAMPQGTPSLTARSTQRPQSATRGNAP
jgi:hypothetical protein